MAINETVRDIENYPTKTKTVTLDLQKIVPLDTEGDEIYVVTSTPGANITKIGGGAVSPIFVRDYKAGYARSSGMKNPPYTITSSNKTFRISIDGSVLRSITLDEGVGLTGESIADDMQKKINALAAPAALEAGNLAFLNATVTFTMNSFLIVAGSISNTYVGVGKSSVQVASGIADDASVTLGLDIPHESEALASKQPRETLVTSLYTAGELDITVESISDLSAGEAFTITDGVNREYFVASGVSTNTISLHLGLDNNYAADAVIQKIFERDPYAELASPYNDLDGLTRFALRSIANQIDFSL